MKKSIITFILMITIFPISNANGKYLDVNGVEYSQLLFANTMAEFTNAHHTSEDIASDSTGKDSVITEEVLKEVEKEEKEALKIAEEVVKTETGNISWYGSKFHGRRTASGEIYDKNGYTCAHKTLPFGTKVRVTNLKNGKSVIVRVNDRGPFVKNRQFDLSQAAFAEIGNPSNGTMKVQYEILKD